MFRGKLCDTSQSVSLRNKSSFSGNGKIDPIALSGSGAQVAALYLLHPVLRGG